MRMDIQDIGNKIISLKHTYQREFCAFLKHRISYFQSATLQEKTKTLQENLTNHQVLLKQ